MIWFLLACNRGPQETAQPEDTGPWYAAPAECGEGVEPGSVTGLSRWPYLQSTTSSGTTLVWGAPADAELGDAALSRDGSYAEPLIAESWTVPVNADRSEEIRLFAATFTDLEPGTEYCYQVTVDGTVLASGLTFRTAPDSPRAPVRFLAMGDYGNGSVEQEMVRDQLLKHAEGVDVFFTLGDNAYGDGDWWEFQDRVFTVYQALWTGMTVFPTSGNHDYKTEEAAPYLGSFVLPRNSLSADDAERYYWADWGPLRFVGLDTETPALQIRDARDDDQQDWLAATLEASGEVPWVIPAFHKPVVSGHVDRLPDLFAKQFFVPLFDQHGVRLVLQGHNHFYERFEPLRNADTPDPDGAVYVVSGGGGAGVYEFHESYEGRVAQAQMNHFLLGEADDCRLHIQAIDLAGVVLDEFTLTRCE